LSGFLERPSSDACGGLMEIEKYFHSAALAVGLMAIENLFRYPALAVGLMEIEN
jgi:hypothetical protein